MICTHNVRNHTSKRGHSRGLIKKDLFRGTPAGARKFPRHAMPRRSPSASGAICSHVKGESSALGNSRKSSVPRARVKKTGTAFRSENLWIDRSLEKDAGFALSINRNHEMVGGSVLVIEGKSRKPKK